MTQSSPSQPFFEILDIVKSEFETKDAYVEEEVPTFIIAPTPHFKEKVENLRSKLKPRRLEIVVRQSEAGIKLLVFTTAPMPTQPRRFFSLSWPLILFVATIISVAISGYLTTSSYLSILRILGRIRPEDEFSFLWEQTALYTLSIMCIVGLHELGHTIACRINHIEASFPIFIPGIPGATPGTFGAIIRQKGPTLNRDQLFDVGFSGPFVGFVTSLIVSYFGYSISLPISKAEYGLLTSAIGSSQPIYLPLIFRLLEPYLMLTSSYTYLLHPLALAGWMGTLITFLNAFPIGQLDGGHIARAVLSPRWNKVLSYAMTIVMFLAGWWAMALLVVLLIRFEHPGTLDDVSPLSRNRKILALLLVVILISCFTVSPDSPITFF